MINERLLKEITEYCNINNIKDIKSKINELLRIGFNIEKYGDSPFYERPTRIDETKEIGKGAEEIRKEEIEKTENDVKEEKPKKRVRIIKN